MTKYIALLQLKGGAGKSTITANLCGYLLSQNATVLTVDADIPQGTLSAWASLTSENENHHHEKAATAEELINILEQAEGQYDYVLIDSPPRMADVMKAILYVSDLSLIPLAATTPDIWATSDMLPMLQDASKERDINARLVFNKLKPTNRSHEIRQQAVDMLELPQLDTALSDYVAYADVIGFGGNVLNHDHKKAKEQFNAFAHEVLLALESTKA